MNKIERMIEKKLEESGSYIEREVIDLIYDTLFQNTQYPQFNPKYARSQVVNDSAGTLSFKYTITETVNDGKLDSPIEVDVFMNIDVKE